MEDEKVHYIVVTGIVVKNGKYLVDKVLKEGKHYTWNGKYDNASDRSLRDGGGKG